MTIPTSEDLLIHILTAIGEFETIRAINVDREARTVTIVRSYEDYCRQCHMGRVQAQAVLTFDEWLATDVGSDDEAYYDSHRVRDLIDQRWEADLVAKRAKGYRYE